MRNPNYIPRPRRTGEHGVVFTKKEHRKPHEEIAEVLSAPKESSEHEKGELLPIQSGRFKYFDSKENKGYIEPDDGQKDLYLIDFAKLYARGEKIDFVKINNFALPVRKGSVESVAIKKGGKKKIVVLPSDQVKEKVRLVMPLTDQGYATNEEFEIDEHVEFVADQDGKIIAIKKAEKKLQHKKTAA